jgi:hypothetical protein
VSASVGVEQAEDVQGDYRVGAGSLGVKVCLAEGCWISGLSGRNGMWVAGDYHSDTILGHVPKHFIQNGVDHMIIRLGYHKAHGSCIQIGREFIRGEYRFPYNTDGLEIVAKPRRHRWR